MCSILILFIVNFKRSCNKILLFWLVRLFKVFSITFTISICKRKNGLSILQRCKVLFECATYDLFDHSIKSSNKYSIQLIALVFHGHLSKMYNRTLSIVYLMLILLQQQHQQLQITVFSLLLYAKEIDKRSNHLTKTIKIKKKT